MFDVSNGTLSSDITGSKHLSQRGTTVALHTATGKSSSARTLFAVGTAAGTVLVWNIGTAELLHSLGVENSADVHAGAVTHVQFSHDGSTLYSTAADKQIKVWNLQSGECVRSIVAGKHAVNRLSLNADSTLLMVGGASLKLLEASTGKVLQKYSGNSKNIAQLCWSADQKYVLSASEHDRFIHVWDVSSGKKSSKKEKDSGAVHTFTLSSNVTHAVFSAHHSSPYHIVAATDNSQVQVFTWSPSSTANSSSATTTASATVIAPLTASANVAARRAVSLKADAKRHGKHGQSAAASTQLVHEHGDETQGAILNVAVKSGSTVLIARGDVIKPKFDSVQYLDAQKQFIDTQTLSPYTAAHLSSDDDTSKAGGKRKTTDSVSVLGPNNYDLAVPSSQLDSQSKKQKLMAAVGADGNTTTIASAAATQTLAERLAAFEADAAKLSSAAAAAGASAMGGATPKAGSLQVILSQALHNSDQALIEYCLNVGSANMNLIRHTLERLSNASVLPLLQHLIEKLQNRPSRASYLVNWIKAIFQIHTAYLLSLRNLHQLLQPLYNTIDTRLSVFKKLLKLNGRLELLLTQIQRQNAIKQRQLQQNNAASAAADVSGPVAVFNDTEDDDQAAAEDSDEDAADSDADMQDSNDEDDDEERDDVVLGEANSSEEEDDFEDGSEDDE